MEDTSQSQSSIQTKLQHDRQKLKDFYNKQPKSEQDSLLKCQPDINEVQKKVNTVILSLKNKNENIEKISEQINSIYEVYEKMDDQMGKETFKEDIESLLINLS